MPHYLCDKKAMGKKYLEIVSEINDFCATLQVKNINRVHIGITNAPKRRLFYEHKITNERHWWIYIKADCAETARAVERYFIDRGMKGNTGGGDDETIYVYCFAKKQDARLA